MYVTLQLLALIRKITTVVFIGLVYQSQRGWKQKSGGVGEDMCLWLASYTFLKGETSGWCPLFAYKNER